jgi:hypothetical protein
MFSEFPPTLLVHSGGGLQAWWLFRELWTLESEEEVRKASALATRWLGALRARAQASGWTIDGVADLTRVLRVPSTANCKVPGNPRPVRLLEVNERRYNPSEIAEYLDSFGPVPAAPVPAVQPATTVAKLVYDPTVDPNLVKFIALSEAEPAFRRTYDHRRKDLPDQSASSYDMALANIAVQAGWSDQEITNLLIAHRRRYNADLKLRDSYYRTTIGKARAMFSAPPPGALVPLEQTAPAESPKVAAPSDDGYDDEDEEEAPPADPLTYLKTRKAFHGIPLVGARKLGRENPHYDLVLEGGRTIGLGGTEDVISPRRARVVMAKDFQRVIPLYTQAKWDKIAQAILTLAGLGEESVMEPSDETRSWLSSFWAVRTPIAEGEVDEDSLRSCEKILLDAEGRAYISASELRKHVHVTFGEVMSTQQLGARLRVLGFEGGKKGRRSWREGKKVVTRRLWRSPTGFHPDKE